ncbi:Ring finger domain [Popillia japonica]|uniref:Ring finger domain n=1 Tax=Popillia japonica TaxID=7064 RepID=A0AAW1ISU5_POPJA
MELKDNCAICRLSMTRHLKDNCAICRLSMTRHDIKRLLPCKHLIHAKCFELSEAIIERVATCPICRTNVLDVEDIIKCFELSEAIIERVATCPICRTNVLDVEDIIRKVYRRYNNQDRERVVARKVYRRYNNQDRERVVASANRGEGWTALAKSLPVHYKTAYHWVNSGREKMLAEGGYKPKILSEEEINTLLSWLEENCSLTLKQIKTSITSIS